MHKTSFLNTYLNFCSRAFLVFECYCVTPLYSKIKIRLFLPYFQNQFYWKTQEIEKYFYENRSCTRKMNSFFYFYEDTGVLRKKKAVGVLAGFGLFLLLNSLILTCFC